MPSHGGGAVFLDGLSDGQAHVANVAVTANSGQAKPAEPAIFLERQRVQNGGMGKDEYREVLQRMGRGVLRELADYMGKKPDNITKMLGPDRPLRAHEVEQLDAFIKLNEHRLRKQPTASQNEHVVVRAREMRSLDADLSHLVPLWEIALTSDGAGGHMSVAKRTDDTEEAPSTLRGRALLSVKVWSDENAPYLTKGMTLFITRSTGNENQWHMFGKQIGRQGDAMQRPLLAVLLEKRPAEWLIRKGTETLTISVRDYPTAWQVRHTQY